MKILLACERSGGHIFPALAFGKKIRRNFLQQDTRKELQIYFFVTSVHLKQYVKKENFKVIGTSLNFRNLLVELFWRPFEALYLILKIRPDKIIGFGGRDSFFLILLGSFLPLETVIYEPNVTFGRANRLLSLFSKRVLRGFDLPEKCIKDKVIGIPLRENIKKINKSEARKTLDFNDKPVVLCLGGSQGSEFINETFLRFVRDSCCDYQIIHLSGYKNFSKVSEFYRSVEKNKFIRDFYYNIEVLYSAADIVISRAGAVTLGEISFYGLPSILIPHPKGGHHQDQNAAYFEVKNAAYTLRQSDFSFPNFSRLLNNLIEDSNLRVGMGGNSQKLGLGVSFEDFCNTDNY